MNPPPDSLENRLLELLHATRDDGSDAARTRLNDLLRGDPSARTSMARLLVNEQALVNRLRQDDMIDTLRTVVRPPQPLARRRLRQVSKSQAAWPALSAAAVLVLSAALGWFVMRPASGNATSSAARPVAVLKATADAVWAGASPATGTSLAPGRLSLDSGMASLEFTSGARLLLEGPAEVELVSGMEILCRSGNLRADVPPPAHGFTIVTPSTRVVDLGTTFGLLVRRDGSSLVKVMQGSIELRRGATVYPVSTHASASIDPAGTTSPADAPDEAFPSEENFRERINAGERQTAVRWKAASAKLAKNPDTLLSFTFQETTRSSRSVRNQAAAPLESHGSLVGADWASGRWKGKWALEFKGRSDSLRFKLDRTAPSATLLAWVRVNSLPNAFNILLAPDYHQHTSAMQWMITRGGELRLAMTNGLSSPASQTGWDGPVMAPAISSLDLGRWVFLASTYDSKTGRVVHYRDGIPVGSGSFEHKLPVKFGLMSFGNWPGRSRNDAAEEEDSADRGDRNFVGSLDELTLLSRALPPLEIAEIYEQGKP